MSKSLVAGKPSITAVVPNSGPTTGGFRISSSSDLQNFFFALSIVFDVVIREEKASAKWEDMKRCWCYEKQRAKD